MTDYASANFHRMLVCDEVRSLAYRTAIREVVRPGDRVLDIGAGSGILSMFASQAGAARVYAVERTGIIGVARRLAKQNGLSEGITFLAQDVLDVELDGPVDVIVSELISKEMIGQGMERLTASCRTRFLKPGGVIIPRSVDFFLAPLTVPACHRHLLVPARSVYDLDLGYLQTIGLNDLHGVRFGDNALLAPGKPVYEIDSMRVTAGQRPDFLASFDVARAGDCHGFGIWFVAHLTATCTLTNFPHSVSWDQAFLPIERPVAVAAGMVIDVRVSAAEPPSGGTVHEWEVSIWADSTRTKSGLLSHERHSTLTALAPLSEMRRMRGGSPRDRSH